MKINIRVSVFFFEIAQSSSLFLYSFKHFTNTVLKSTVFKHVILCLADHSYNTKKNLKPNFASFSNTISK